MKKILAGTMALLALSYICVPDNRAANMTGKDVSASNNAFGFDLLRKLQDPKNVENIFISPTSICSACTMAYFGAAGPCKTEMGQVFKISSEDVSGAYADLNSSLAALNGPCQFTNANAIFVDTAFKFKASFVDLCKKAFSAECKSLALNSDAGIEAVNNWAKVKTNNKIPKLITSPPPDLAAILTNAVYFKGKWQAQFDKNKTTPDDFHNADGTTKKVQMMLLDGDVQGYVGDGFKAAMLPYQGKRLKAYFFVPDKSSGLEKMLKTLSVDTWNKWLKLFSKKEEAVVQIPRFTLESGKSLVAPLKSLGMTKAFDFNQADFNPMFEDNKKRIRIADVIHKTFVQVNEEGTEAAAATAVLMQAESARFIPDKFVMKADHPFLFAIADEKTSTILFLGLIQRLGPDNSK